MTTYIEVFVYATLIFYCLAAGIYFTADRFKNLAWIAPVLATAGFITNTLTLVARSMLVGRLPLANGAEFLLCFAWFTVLGYLLYERKSRTNHAGGVATLIAGLLIASIITLVPSQLGDVRPLMPALKSPWLTSHVLTAVIAYGGFALAAALAAIQLKKASPENNEEWIYKIVAASFLMLTVTIVLGAVWAEQAWGRYWSWDPKETWALVTWFVYAGYLHLRRQQFWRGKNANLLVVGGFIFVLFTYFGVNFLLSGLHSYS